MRIRAILSNFGVLHTRQQLDEPLLVLLRHGHGDAVGVDSVLRRKNQEKEDNIIQSNSYRVEAFRLQEDLMAIFVREPQHLVWQKWNKIVGKTAGTAYNPSAHLGLNRRAVARAADFFLDVHIHMKALCKADRPIRKRA